MPMPVQAASAPASAAPEPTQNRPPGSLDPAREGSAIHGAPTHIGASFDDEIVQQRAVPSRPARAPTRVAPMEPAPTERPPQLVATEVQARPREPEPVGLYLGAPTVTAAGPAGGGATRTEPALPAATHTTTEEEPPPLGLPSPTAPLPAGVPTAPLPAGLPTAPLLTGAPTLELPASTVAPDDRTRLKLAPGRRTRSLSWIVGVVVIVVGGSAAGITLRMWRHGASAAVDGTQPAKPAQQTGEPTASAPVKPEPPVSAAATPLPPPPVAPAVTSERPPPASTPPVEAAPATPTAPPVAPPVPSSAPAPTTRPPEPAQALPRPSPPVRAADGFGPFLDPSGAGLGAALGEAIRLVLGDALKGNRVGVRGEVRRAAVVGGAATVECALLVFDDTGQRATVRGAARFVEEGARREALLRQAAAQCARSVESELRAGVEHARGRR